MPTYEYACTSCGERLEVVQKFSDDPLTVCPACEGALRKVFSPVGVVFKGSGFYKTDSRTSKTSAGATSDSTKSDSTKSDGAAKEKTGADAATTPAAETKPAASGTSTDTSKSSSVGTGDRVA
jgi:putative FmdB family regulatory protein